MASITLKNICKIYPGNIKAVDNFNLEIKDKEFIVLVGPSGCGKSTTLRMIAGLEEISSGELFIDDKLVNSLAPKDRDIAMVFQNYALYPHMTIYKNMAFGLELKKVPKLEIEKKVNEVAKKLEIELYLDRKPKSLSGGQRQRVALGRAMVRDPKVFLLDEPLSNLDAKLRSGMRSEISKLHLELGTTFVYVTHDQVEAMTMGDRIVIMKDGLIQQIDNPQNIYKLPCNLFVASFIGSPQMNFMKGKLSIDNNIIFIEIGGNKYKLPKEKGEVDKFLLYLDKEVIIGIRPEEMDVDVSPGVNQIAIDGVVDISEMLGAEAYMYINCCCSEKNITVRVPANKHTAHGTKVKLIIDLNRIHIFDKLTEAAICN